MATRLHTCRFLLVDGVIILRVFGFPGQVNACGFFVSSNLNYGLGLSSRCFMHYCAVLNNYCSTQLSIQHIVVWRNGLYSVDDIFKCTLLNKRFSFWLIVHIHLSRFFYWQYITIGWINSLPRTGNKPFMNQQMIVNISNAIWCLKAIISWTESDNLIWGNTYDLSIYAIYFFSIIGYFAITFCFSNVWTIERLF